MVNYCCVASCGRNSRSNSQLNFYTFPKEPARQMEWLKAAKREDLVARAASGALRICSRHFELSAIKNWKLSPDAVPTLCFSDSENDTVTKETPSHNGIVCDNCKTEIRGFRYKCVTCDDYDLCIKCEARELHPGHFMLRISRNLLYKDVTNLVNKWRLFFQSEHLDVEGTEVRNVKEFIELEIPPTEYLSEDMKKLIQNEVASALSLQGANKVATDNLDSTDNGDSTNNQDSGLLDMRTKKKRIDYSISLQDHGVRCDNCLRKIYGFRYTCVLCVDYDLCHKCEQFRQHGEHYMLRIPIANDKEYEELIMRCRKYLAKKKNPALAISEGSDDEPITKYLNLKEEPMVKETHTIFF